MSITDPVVIVCEPGHDLPYFLQQGRETFYDEKDIMRRWPSCEQAVRWAMDNLGVSPLEHLPGQAKVHGEAVMKRWRQRGDQTRLPGV